ncbi:MAG: hypothetical protein M1420_01225, partial [Actinobacteria bacterium]|nr:hypothetical protein [Actinomycetota bacterium]
MVTENSYEDHDAAYREVRSGCTVVPVARDIVSVRGPDALKFLQGQLTQDLSSLEEGRCVDSFLLQPQGTVVALVRVTRTGEDKLLVDTDAGWGRAVARRLEKFKIRTDATIQVLSWTVTSIRGLGADGVLGTMPGKPADCHYLENDVYIVRVAWPGISGYDLFCSGGAGVPAIDNLQSCPWQVYEAVRIEAGLPAMGREIDERTMPAATGIVGRAVSFSKGCYVGQELVERIDARGSRSPQRLCGMVSIAEEPAMRQPDIRGVSVTQDGRPVGTVTSAAWSPGYNAVVCLAYLARKVEVPATVHAGGVEFRALSL